MQGVRLSRIPSNNASMMRSSGELLSAISSDKYKDHDGRALVEVFVCIGGTELCGSAVALSSVDTCANDTGNNCCVIFLLLC